MLKTGLQTIGEFFDHKQAACAIEPGSVFVRKAAERETIAGLPAILEAVVAAGQTILVTVEADVDAGNFPDFLCSFFRDKHWDYDRLFFVPELLKHDRHSSFLVGRITFEADPGMLTRLILSDFGVWQCPNQTIGGVVVSDAAAESCVRLSPWMPTEFVLMATEVRAAFKIDNDLFTTEVWIPDSDDAAGLGRLLALFSEEVTGRDDP